MKLSVKMATVVGMVAIVFWSTLVGVTRSAIEALGPVGAPAVMFTASAAIQLLRRNSLSAVPRSYLYLGASLFVGYELCFVSALGLARNRLETIEVSMVNYLWPSLTVLFSVIWGRQKLNMLILAGLGLAIAGVMLASSPPDGLNLARFFSNARENPLCYGLALMGAIVWGLYSASTRYLAQGKDGLWFFMILTAASFWVLFFLQGGQPIMQWSGYMIGLVFLSSIVFALAYQFWNVGMMRGSIQALGLAANATPLLSALFASLLLVTPLSKAFWIGAAFIGFGSFVASMGFRYAEKS